MKQISYDSAVQLIYRYTDKLAKEGKLNKKEDNFSIVLPFEHHCLLAMFSDLLAIRPHFFQRRH